jgi:hypothetical protein
LLLTVSLCLCSARPALAGCTLGALLGAARTQPSSIGLELPAASTALVIAPVRYRSESFTPPFYYAYRIGSFPGARWLGIEGELIHLKVLADTARPAGFHGTLRGEAVSGTRPISSLVERFSITHGVNLLLVNAVGRRTAGVPPGTAPRWIVTGRAGVGASLPHAESTIAGDSQEQYQWGSLSLQAAAGAEVRARGRVYVAAEYKLTRSVQAVSVAGGSARTPLTTHHVAAGVALHWGRMRGH